jgi:thioredoxin-related protein
MIRKVLLAALCGFIGFNSDAQDVNKTQVATAQPAQTAPAVPDNRLPCQKNTTIPSFNITLIDSAIFSTAAIKEGKKTAFVVFGPDCSHCRDFFRQLFVGIDTLTNIDFYLVTPIRSYLAFRNFYGDFNLDAHKNIKAAGRDLDFFAMEFFGVKQFPYIILYDEHKKLIGGFGPGPAMTELHN